jgi:hypothetical protein
MSLTFSNGDIFEIHYGLFRIYDSTRRVLLTHIAHSFCGFSLFGNVGSSHVVCNSAMSSLVFSVKLHHMWLDGYCKRCTLNNF